MGAMPPTPAHWCSASAASVARRELRTSVAHTGSARWARCRSSTPDPALDVLANGWLLYQTIACRLWARSGYYQSGGAFGFRDQLQDAMALLHARPELLRAQMLLRARTSSRRRRAALVASAAGAACARTCSDDYLWLPLAVPLRRWPPATPACSTSRALPRRAVRCKDGEESYYDLPQRVEPHATLYEHCVRAIEHGLRRARTACR
jgi:cyclic beta-1,2-glucan synthetase